MKKIFITGGAGFIANTIIKRLINEYQITVYDNFERDTLSSSGVSNHRNLNIIKGDVLDYEMLLLSMKKDVPDIVIHAAAIAGVDTVRENPVKTMRVNMIGTANILEVCRILKIKDRVIEFSTSEVFGSMAFKSKEEDETIAGSAGEARWVYAVSKLAGEHLSKSYHTQYNLPVVTIRPFNIYGPGQSANGALQIFIEKALKNEDIYINGDGNQIRAWCFVDDFVDGIVECITNPKAIGESFNIGNPRAVITILGLAQTICRVLKSKTKIIFNPPLSADIAIRIPSVDKVREMLGVTSKIDLEEGILKTAEFIKKIDLEEGILKTTEFIKKMDTHDNKNFLVENLEKLGDNSVLEKGVLLFHPENIIIHGNVYVGHNTILKAYYKNKMEIGEGTWIGQQCFFHSAGGIKIGVNVGIGPGVKIITSYHKDTDTKIPILHEELEFKGVTIEDDSDLGVNSVIMPGITIKKGTQVGAGSVVTKNFPPYSVIAGVPAKLIKKRNVR